MRNSEFFAKAGHLRLALDDFVSAHTLAGMIAVDHICYKCDSSASFESLRSRFELEGNKVRSITVPISGRRIATFTFDEIVLPSSIGEVHHLELSDQKPDHSQREGFDHVEVCAVEGAISYDALIGRLLKDGVPLEHIVRPHHTTYETPLRGGFTLKFAREPLIESIRKELY